MPRAWVEIKNGKVSIGAEHVPHCPNTVELNGDQEYCQRAMEAAGRTTRHVEFAFDAATTAIEPPWLVLLSVVCAVLWFLRPWRDRLRSDHVWHHDGSSLHFAQQDSCSISLKLDIPDEERQLCAAHAAHLFLRDQGYTVEDEALIPENA